MSMYENVGMTSLDYMEEILRLRKALADVADECSKAYDRIAQLENPWVSVEDRMPNEGVNVLTYGARPDYDVIYINRLIDEKQWLYDGVTHWMPLPTPPEKPYEEWDRIAKEREDAVH